MDWLSKLFDAFDRRVVALDDGRVGRVRSAYSALDKFAREDGPLSGAFLDLYLQGSVAIGTAVKPSKQGREFDADAVLLLDVTKRSPDKQSPVDVIPWLAARLRTCPHFKDKVRERPRCVRIEYAGDFHFDVVPGHPIWGTDVILVPDKEGGWRRSSPKGYISWAHSVEEKSDGRFTVVARLSKYWRDVKFAEDTKPKSILLTTLIGNHTPMNANSVPEAFVLTLEALERDLGVEVGVPMVSNPSLPTENLARDWSQEAFDLFCARVSSAAAKARAAYRYAANDRDRSTQLWIEFFGDRFPRKTEEDGRLFREATASGTAYVGPTGAVASGSLAVSGTPIQQHRFYGSENSSTRT